MPGALRCRVKRGEVVRLEVVEVERGARRGGQPVGLRVLGGNGGAHDQQADDRGLVVQEDHGQVVSRDEVYAALGLAGGAGVVEEVAPVFEESAVRIEGVVEGVVEGGDRKRKQVDDANETVEAVMDPGAVKRKKGRNEGHVVAGVAPSADAVQFVRIGAPPTADRAKAEVKPLITRLEEEKKRKRKKKKAGGGGGKSPWDDLF